MSVDLDGVTAFLPGSQIDTRQIIKDTKELLNKPLDLMILKMDKYRGNIVVSRKAISDVELKEQRAEILSTIKEGSIVEGKIKNITDYGIFVDDAESFHYEDDNNPALDSGDRYGIGINAVDALIVEGDTSLVGAAFTAVVSAAGTIQGLITTNVGSGYTAGPIHINFAAPQSVGVGVGTTAFAKATITNGSVSSVR